MGFNVVLNVVLNLGDKDDFETEDQAEKHPAEKHPAEKHPAEKPPAEASKAEGCKAEGCKVDEGRTMPHRANDLAELKIARQVNC